MSIRIVAFIITLLLVPMLTSAKVKQTKLKLHTAKQVKIPKSIVTENLTFKKAHIEKFDDSRYGAIISYKDKKHPLIVVSYYIYPMSDENIPVEYLMSVQHEGVKAQIIEANKIKGNTADLIVEELQQVGNHQTFFTKHSINGDLVDLVSDTYLTHDRYHYLKLRVSFPRHMAVEYNALSTELADLLIANTTVKEHKGTSISISLNGNIEDQSHQTIIIMQLAFLSLMMEGLEQNDLIVDYDQILNALESVAEVSEIWFERHEKPNHLIFFHEIKQAGYLDEFIWSFMQQPHWVEPEGLNLLEFHQWFMPNIEKTNPISADFGRLVIDFD